MKMMSAYISTGNNQSGNIRVIHSCMYGVIHHLASSRMLLRQPLLHHPSWHILCPWNMNVAQSKTMKCFKCSCIAVTLAWKQYRQDLPTLKVNTKLQNILPPIYRLHQCSPDFLIGGDIPVSFPFIHNCMWLLPTSLLLAGHLSLHQINKKHYTYMLHTFEVGGGGGA